MNIAFYSHYFTPEIGAPSARIHDMAREWMRSGHQVQVITCFPNHPVGKLYPGYRSGLYRHENLEGIDVHRHWTYITPNKGFVKKTLGHVSYLPSAALLSNRKVKGAEVAIGTSPTFFAAMAAARLARRRKIPFIMEVRDLWPALFVELGVLRNPRLIGWLERLEMSLYKQASKVVVVTEAFRENLIKRSIPQEKVLTIPNGADVEFWQPAEPSLATRKQFGMEKDSFVVLYIGAHGISQELLTVLKSARQLQEHRQIQFLFVGEGAKKEELVQQSREMGLNNVRFLGSVDKHGVREFYALANVCLVPLRKIPLFETFIPSKMFEIMAMARPIIGSLAGEAAGILQRSGGATVVGPEDHEAMAGAIVDLYRNRDQTYEMGRRGRDFVVKNYSRQSLAAAYAEVINEAVSDYHRKK